MSEPARPASSALALGEVENKAQAAATAACIKQRYPGFVMTTSFRQSPATKHSADSSPYKLKSWQTPPLRSERRISETVETGKIQPAHPNYRALVRAVKLQSALRPLLCTIRAHILTNCSLLPHDHARQWSLTHEWHNRPDTLIERRATLGGTWQEKGRSKDVCDSPQRLTSSHQSPQKRVRVSPVGCCQRFEFGVATSGLL